MKWNTGNHSSLPDDQRTFLEQGRDDLWYAYKTGEDGRMMEGFPKLREEGFATVAEAQAWVEANVPPKEIEPDVIQQAVAADPSRIVWAETDEVTSDLQPWIDTILKANGVKSAFISNESTMGDLISHDTDGRLTEVRRLLGIQFELSDSVCEIARRLRDDSEQTIH